MDAQLLAEYLREATADPNDDDRLAFMVGCAREFARERAANLAYDIAKAVANQRGPSLVDTRPAALAALLPEFTSLSRRMSALGVRSACHEVPDPVSPAAFLNIVESFEGQTFRERIVRANCAMTRDDLDEARALLDDAAGVQESVAHHRMLTNHRMRLALLLGDYERVDRIYGAAPRGLACSAGLLTNRAIALGMLDDRRFSDACADLLDAVHGRVPLEWAAVAAAASHVIASRLKLDKLDVERGLGISRALSCSSSSAPSPPPPRRSS